MDFLQGHFVSCEKLLDFEKGIVVIMKLKRLSNRSSTGYTTFGCIWKPGECTTETSYVVKSGQDDNIPMESNITAYYEDGSVKWTKHTVDVTHLEDIIEVLPCDKKLEFHGNVVNETKTTYQIISKNFNIKISKESPYIFDEIYVNNKLKMKNGTSVLTLEEPKSIDGFSGKINKNYTSIIHQSQIESNGKLETVIKFEGIHCLKEDEKIPFIIRMKVGYHSKKIDYIYTFVYNGEEEKDYLKGLGITFEKPMVSPMYNRHIKMATDYGCFHEVVVPLMSWRPRIPLEDYEKQMEGQSVSFSGKQAEDMEFILANTPYWSEYDLCQRQHNSFTIKKKLYGNNLCYIDSLTGYRAKGAVSFGDEDGSVLISTRDFWQKYPGGFTVKDLDQDVAKATVWLWSPTADAMDFRHYANRGYNQVCYEGYDFKGASPYGIASTSEFAIAFDEAIIPTDDSLIEFSKEVNHPPVYVGEPEYYHDLKAFGYWSMIKKDTKSEIWLEEQLEKAVDFYIKEVEQRSWYGLFNYGDFMHTYDKVRKNWKYDIGGYAWDNTELVPTLWLWLMFLRTGREDIFTLAEKLSRHTSDVDVYHIGKWKGLGSRHNVSHWGCPCKEARIAMAHHHRYYYYMTGDYRLSDIFEELKDNEMAFLEKDPLETFYDKAEMQYKSHARTGPDWSSLCSNWMTYWERFNDPTYRDKITVGIEDIKKAPLKLVSGHNFEFDPYTNHLLYIGENGTGGSHLQICMGSPQIWLELSYLLKDEEWTDMLAQYGRFYFLDREEQIKESNGLIGKKEFSFPYMAASMGAFGANYLDDKELAKKTWNALLKELLKSTGMNGFEVTHVSHGGNKENLEEIPWISTNFVAQWCLNVIMCLDFIREDLPKDLEKIDLMLYNKT